MTTILPSWGRFLASLFDDATHCWNQHRTSSGNSIPDSAGNGCNDAMRMNPLHRRFVGNLAGSLGMVIPLSPW
jgi:hypothetical protein